MSKIKRGYSVKHDAEYSMKTGVWLEMKCEDPECCFCKDRPKRAKIIKKELIGQTKNLLH